MQQSFEESGRPQRLACIFGRNHMLADTLEKSPTEILNEIAKWQWLLEQRFSTYYPDIDKWHSPTSHGRFALETFTKIMHNIQAYAGGEGLRQTEIEVPDLLKLFGRAGEAA